MPFSFSPLHDEETLRLVDQSNRGVAVLQLGQRIKRVLRNKGVHRMPPIEKDTLACEHVGEKQTKCH